MVDVLSLAMAQRQRCKVIDVSDERLTVAQAAERAGVQPATWRAYVSRGQAPPADGAHDQRTPWWWASTVDRWLRARPRKTGD